MIAFQLYSEMHQCDLQFKFDTQGRICGFEIMGETVMSGEQLSNFLAKLPQSIGILKQYCIKKKLELVELKQDVSFEAFWNAYNYKDGSSRRKTEAVWDRMSEKDKTMAINWIPKYKNILIKQGVSKMYATTYLNDKRWEN